MEKHRNLDQPAGDLTIVAHFPKALVCHAAFGWIRLSVLFTTLHEVSSEPQPFVRIPGEVDDTRCDYGSWTITL